MTAQTSHNRQNHEGGDLTGRGGVHALTALDSDRAPVDVTVEADMGRVVITTEHGDSLDFDMGELLLAAFGAELLPGTVRLILAERVA